MDVFYSLCHSILCRRGELASIYAPQLVQILLGGVGLLDVLADNDTFCSFSHSKYVQMIVSFTNCPAEAVRAEGCRMIQHYVGLGRELKGRASEKDLRVRMFNFSVDTAFPASPLPRPASAERRCDAAPDARDPPVVWRLRSPGSTRRVRTGPDRFSLATPYASSAISYAALRGRPNSAVSVFAMSLLRAPSALSWAARTRAESSALS